MQEIQITTTLTCYDNVAELPIDVQKLMENAVTARKSAYAPYSQFRVGVAITLENGAIVSGSNQENAAYPSGLCAERVALFQAGSIHPDKKIKQIAVVAKKSTENEFRPVSPCGSCRQVMLEFEHKQDHPIEIIFQTAEGWLVIKSTKLLLPFCFDKNNL